MAGLNGAHVSGADELGFRTHTSLPRETALARCGGLYVMIVQSIEPFDPNSCNVAGIMQAGLGKALTRRQNQTQAP